jgi:Rod binding domain-containing protein
MTSLGIPAIDSGGADLDALRRAAPEQAGPEAARQLEVVFLVQLLQAMRKTVPENDFLPRSPERDVYEGVFDRAVAEVMAAGDPLGLVQTVATAGLKSGSRPADNPAGEPGALAEPAEGRQR